MIFPLAGNRIQIDSAPGRAWLRVLRHTYHLGFQAIATCPSLESKYGTELVAASAHLLLVAAAVERISAAGGRLIAMVALRVPGIVIHPSADGEGAGAAQGAILWDAFLAIGSV